MKYRPLPFVETLTTLSETDPASALEQRATAMSEFARSRGAQLITHILREIEARALQALRLGIDPSRVGRALGRIEAVEEIRQSLTHLLPEGERGAVDWFDDQEEEFVTVGSETPNKE